MTEPLRGGAGRKRRKRVWRAIKVCAGCGKPYPCKPDCPAGVIIAKGKP